MWHDGNLSLKNGFNCDLSLRVKVRQDDEFQELADELDRIVASLRERITFVKENAEELSKTVTYLEYQATRNPSYTTLEAVRLAMVKKAVDNMLASLETVRVEPLPETIEGTEAAGTNETRTGNQE